MTRPLPLLLLLAALLALPVRADDILLRKGNDITGVRIEREGVDKIEYRKPGVGSVQSVSTPDVRDVRYGRTSPDFQQALDLFGKGELGQAASYFAAAADDETLAANIRATALVEAADALFTNENLQDALGLYDRLLKEHPGSRHLPRALLGRARTLLFLRQFAPAKEAFAALQAETAAKGFGERWAFEAEFGQLLADEAQGADVAQGYEGLRTRAAADYPEIANKCAVRLGEVKAAAGQGDEAQELFEQIITSRLQTEADIVAQAFNGRGRVRFERGLAALKGKKNDEALVHFRAALLDFLRVFVSYKGVHREQAEALYFGGLTYLNIASLDPAAPEASSRGRALLATCRDQFSGSEWAKKAAEVP